ncbi:MAG: putative arsenical pump-driving ATPase [Methanomassiliicoccales archaeon PtaU1.Bin124]|nr:MAG: putative arsenical pump-driving ATPase [Methanomassiliicoccales archaeon PtaU1.Bin124]
MRLIIYTGKGGVGKTSVSAATALKCARLGYRTIVMSTDSAHSLADSLDLELSGEVRKIEKNLDAIEVDVLYEMEHRWKEIEKYFSDFMESQGLDPISAKEMAVFPGMELMSALFYVEDFYKEGKYDVVVMDTAPTADTMRLLSFPEVGDYYFDKFYRIMRNMVKLARATVGKFMSTPLPSNELMDDLEHIRDRLKFVREILQNPETTSIRLVMNPERMVINETKRAFTYLSLYNLTVEAIVINRLIPENLYSRYPKEKISEQDRYMDMIHESFGEVKQLKGYLFTTEVLGKDSLTVLGDMVFGKDDPSQIYSTEKSMIIYREKGQDIISLKLPYTEKSEVELYKSNDVLIVRVGWYKRSVSLPYALVKKQTSKAEFKNGRLLVYFEEVKDDAKSKKAE